jgi:hypothetical protein
MTKDELIEVLTHRAVCTLARPGIGSPEDDPKGVERIVKKGTKHDHDKPVVSLIDPDWLLEVAEVLTFGANKYAPDNWKHVGDAQARYLSAAYRHLLAYQKGQENDSESNLSHLAHASCCLMFLHYLEKNKE